MRSISVITLLLLAGCASSPATDTPADAASAPDAAGDAATSIRALPPREPQRPGDPAAGFQALVTRPYVSCGIPLALYRRLSGAANVGSALGFPAEAPPIPGRGDLNDGLPYYLTATRDAEGAEVVSTNCLTCHASVLRGELVIGLGNPNLDFTFDARSAARAGGALLADASDAERAAYDKWSKRVQATAPAVRVDTVGVNTADNLAAFLFGHRDVDTLAWHDDWQMPPAGEQPIPLSVPPWWWLKHKNAMFLTGGGRGDFARVMMTASILCTDSVPEAEAIDAWFPDIRAYIDSIQAPPYPLPVDEAAAARGRAVYASACASCHGSYGGPDGKTLDYPNLVVPAEVVGTDPLLVRFIVDYAGNYVDLWDRSFYGQTTDMVATGGYVAPPLEGVWATAPYFHNDSVPTLEGVLDSRERPKYWTREFSADAYDPALPGYPYRELPAGKDVRQDVSARFIYDTTRTGYGNGGHTYGDALSDTERADLLAFLKTL